MVENVIYYTRLPGFKYYRPSSLTELLELKDKFREEAYLLAGGTDLLVDLRLRVKKPRYIIDLKGVRELHQLEYTSDRLAIGATTTLKEVEEYSVVREKYPILWSTVKKLADPVIRSRATLVGNLCNASPAADTAPPLLIYNSVVEIASVNGVRRVWLRDFFKGVKKTVLEPNEVVTKVYVPEPPVHTGEYFKVGRSVEDIAVVGIALFVSNPEDPLKRVVRLAYSSVAPTPVLVEGVEELFRSNRSLGELIDKTIEVVMSSISPISDIRGSREYRLHVIEYCTRYLLYKYLGGGV